MTKRVLFMCPHGAAKSLMAAAIARAVAAREGLDIACSNAGTEPDETNNPLAIAELERRGLSASSEPRMVSRVDLETADVVVTMGVEAADLPLAPRRHVDWGDVPNASDDAAALFDVLDRRIRDLLVDLD